MYLKNFVEDFKNYFLHNFQKLYLNQNKVKNKGYYFHTFLTSNDCLKNFFKVLLMLNFLD